VEVLPVEPGVDHGVGGPVDAGVDGRGRTRWRGVALRRIETWYQGATGRRKGKSGAVTAIQRLGPALNLDLHFHIVHLDGVFDRGADDALHFFLRAPSTGDIEGLGLPAAGDDCTSGDPAAFAPRRAWNAQHDSVPDGTPNSTLARAAPTSSARSVAFRFSSAVYVRDFRDLIDDLRASTLGRTGVSGVSGQLRVVRVRQEQLREMRRAG